MTHAATIGRHVGSVPNRILSALTPKDYARILPDLRVVPLNAHTSLLEPGDLMPYVYFPNRGVISLLTVMKNGVAIECATIGNEGMADPFVFLGGRESDSRLLVQVRGSAMRMDSARFRSHVAELPALREAMAQYAIVLFALVSQSAACSRMHTMVERCARWLLMTHDRVEDAEFYMTHEFLAEMLGVRRPSVSVAAETLQKADLISYHRGNIEVVNRAGLEAASCECYAVIQQRFDPMRDVNESAGVRGTPPRTPASA